MENTSPGLNSAYPPHAAAADIVVAVSAARYPAEPSVGLPRPGRQRPPDVLSDVPVGVSVDLEDSTAASDAPVEVACGQLADRVPAGVWVVGRGEPAGRDEPDQLA